MNKQPVHYAFVASLSGFLFGFDTVVISGANLPIKALWNTTEWFHGFFVMSVALQGTLLGSILGNIPCDRIGRKNTLFWIAVFYLISAVGTALATDPYFFSVYRFIGGMAIGVSTIAAPAYISEISPYTYRGKLVATFQVNIVLGILLAFVSNYALTGIAGANDWRLMMGMEAIPALIFLILVTRIPESPRWLIVKRKKVVEGMAILGEIFGEDQKRPRMILDNIVKEQELTPLLSAAEGKGLKNPYILAFMMAFFNQMSGINFILYYAPEIMEKAGLVANQSLLGAIFIGGANLIFTIWGLSMIDGMGRKHLMFIGSAGYLISLSMVVFGFYTQASPTFNLFGMIIFISAHAIGQGTVIWVFISEIFNNQQRARGQSFGAGVHWGMAALVTLFGSALIAWLEPWLIFAIFLVFTFLQTLFVLLLMPETKGKPLERIHEGVEDISPQPIYKPKAGEVPANFKTN